VAVSITGYNQLDTPDPLQPADLATKNYVDGQLSRSGTVIHEMAKYGQSWGNTASTTYVPTGVGQAQLFTKLYASTILRVHMGVSGYGSPAGTYMTWGISPTNTTTDVVQVLIGWFNTASYHVGFSGTVDITGRAAGNYYFTALVHSNATTATVYGDANDQLWYRVAEVWP
jgi:hypothetical protein